MELSIIIVSWNSQEKILQNLTSIFQGKINFELEVFLVDNNSQDNTQSIVQEAFPQVKIISNQENLGFAKANNLAYAQANGDIILFLNPDMKVFEDTLEKLVDFFENNKNINIIGPKLLDEKNNLVAHIRRFPTIFDQLMIILKIPHIVPSVLNSYLYKNFDYTKEQEAPTIRGSFFAIRKLAAEKLEYAPKKLWDERFFLWFEDVDLCKRAWLNSFKIIYTPKIQAIDHVGQSFKLLKRYSAQKLFISSMFKYFRKWGIWSA